MLTAYRNQIAYRSICGGESSWGLRIRQAIRMRKADFRHAEGLNNRKIRNPQATVYDGNVADVFAYIRSNGVPRLISSRVRIGMSRSS